jgi:hypothetical protein
MSQPSTWLLIDLFFTTRRYPVQYRLMAKHCSMWRNYHDIQDNVESLWDVLNYWATL